MSGKSNNKPAAKTPEKAASASPQKSSPVPTFLGHAARRRTPWLVLIACLIGVGIFLSSQFRKGGDDHRMGIIEYSSDDPDAQVIMEKDGQPFLLEKGVKFSKQVEPGHYTLKLATPSEGLKLQPSLINMDPGGRAFVTVRYIMPKTGK